MTRSGFSPGSLAEKVLAGDRSALGRAITLIESGKSEHQEQAHAVLDRCLERPRGDSFRIGITGSPGAGKSTLIEALGLEILKEPRNRLAVLAIDPSSTRSGGSILGDKARMERLASRQEAFIRPSPSSGHLGGTSPRTHEAILLCEAAGYNIVLVETVGVGQSEISVEAMVDYILLLMLPGSGDELQGIKRGIMEIADGIALTKTDEAPAKSVANSRSAFASALSLLPKKHPGWSPSVIPVSSVNGEGIAGIWKDMRRFRSVLGENGLFEENRKKQLDKLFRSQVDELLLKAFYANAELRSSLPAIAAAVRDERVSPFSGAKRLVESIIRSPR
ncbi:methylmalonyl Co-A mutase-associated GTPase MeaB [Prosthecochloris sp. GSB1]|uniref:methylmalonyl Co-A mutase-associated GTPase MeaB n=1 Tax=Prosthecochloris sp. GSB1 TaxID=281093 RepID=UPI000B8CA019|nr:methylmalonyl Co-A mutase-associated GTPase MeaB [Prosthecochloris sp. GSB1]ASQ90678.1 methylmalonyl Co-A mutase-associated GTPase MeaB [Prosthecochloris sp. GSB1]